MDKKNNILLKVKKIIQETFDTITIKFHKNYFKGPFDAHNLQFNSNSSLIEYPIQYFPGQYLNLCIPLHDKTYYRAYSLSSCPYIDEDPSITIKRVDKGLISNYLIDNKKSIDYILSNEPTGKFIYDKDTSNFSTIVCVAAGSGITPLLSIIKTVLFKTDFSVSLVYTNRDQNSIIFKEFLENLKSIYGARFSYIQFITKPTSVLGKNINIGRPTIESFGKIFKSINTIDTTYYLCGPYKMMEAAYKALADLGISLENIKWENFGDKEHFFTSNKIVENIKKVKNEKAKVKIHYEDEIYDIYVNTGQTILDAALDEEIDLPFACNSGTCNVCQAKCLSGRVNMEHDEGLTEEEIEQNYILTCVSKPITEEVEIKIP